MFAVLVLALFLAFCAHPLRTSTDAYQTRLSLAGITVEIPQSCKANLLEVPSLATFGVGLEPSQAAQLLTWHVHGADLQ